MKKMLIILLFIFSLCLVSCGQDSEEETTYLSEDEIKTKLATMAEKANNSEIVLPDCYELTIKTQQKFGNDGLLYIDYSYKYVIDKENKIFYVDVKIKDKMFTIDQNNVNFNTPANLYYCQIWIYPENNELVVAINDNNSRTYETMSLEFFESQVNEAYTKIKYDVLGFEINLQTPENMMVQLNYEINSLMDEETCYYTTKPEGITHVLDYKVTSSKEGFLDAKIIHSLQGRDEKGDASSVKYDYAFTIENDIPIKINSLVEHKNAFVPYMSYLYAYSEYNLLINNYSCSFPNLQDYIKI